MNLHKEMVYAEIKDYAFITLGLLLYTFAWTVFLLPYQIVTGGVTGISALIFFATKIPIVYTYVPINAALLVVALFVLGFKFMAKTIYAIFVLGFFVSIAQQMVTQADGTMVQILGPGQEFMSVIIGCCITGTALSIVFLHNGSTGGTDIVAAVVNKYHNLSLGTVLIIVDVAIISTSYFVFNDWKRIVLGMSSMAVECFVLDFVMNSRRESVQFLIFSRKYKEIAEAIGTELYHGVTILDGHGWYTGNEVKVLCVLAKKYESQHIFFLIKMIDPNAFVSQSAVIGVYGQGFDEMKVRKAQKKKLKQVISKDEGSNENSVCNQQQS